MELKKGMRIRCVIDGTYIEDATVQKEGSWIFICQNERDGNRCKDPLGYKYSWAVGEGNDTDQLYEKVTNVELLTLDCVSDLRNLEGSHIECTIYDAPVNDAVVHKEGGAYYICQDVCKGEMCKNTHGYLYSWGVGRGTPADLIRYSVINVKLTGKITNVVDYMQLGEIGRDGNGV